MADAYLPPIARLPETRIQEQAQEIRDVRKTGGIQHGRDELVMIVNEARQVVYASPGLVSIFCTPDDDGLDGKRPGDLFGCVHAGMGECGHTENCQVCGAAAAILNTQLSLQEGANECVIETGGNGHPVTYNFNVRTFPIEVNADRFVMLLLDDIGAEKHRAALERIFFHDILNTVAGLKSYLDLLKRQVISEPDKELVVRIGEITGVLVDEIQSQKLFASAESGTLSAARQFIVSGDLVESIMVHYADHDLCRGKQLVTAPFTESLSFISDETILRRALGNMVTNALEACDPGDIVTLGCRRVDGDAVFSVQNPGVIPEDVRLQIYHRFFSTKGSDRGLGTYSIKLLTETYLGGRVWFTSDKQNGTVFNISIPLEVKAEPL